MYKFRITYSIIIGLLIYVFYNVAIKQPPYSALSDDRSKMNSVITAIYCSHLYNNKCPDNLQQLVDEDILDQHDIELDTVDLFYLKFQDLEEPNMINQDPEASNKIILYTSSYGPNDACHGQALVAYADFRIERVERHELEQLLAQEIVRLRGKLSTNEIK